MEASSRVAESGRSLLVIDTVDHIDSSGCDSLVDTWDRDNVVLPEWTLDNKFCLVNALTFDQWSGRRFDRACGSGIASYPRLLYRFHWALLFDLFWRTYRRLVPLQRSVYVFQRVPDVDKCIVNLKD